MSATTISNELSPNHHSEESELSQSMDVDHDSRDAFTSDEAQDDTMQEPEVEPRRQPSPSSSSRPIVYRRGQSPDPPHGFEAQDGSRHGHEHEHEHEQEQRYQHARHEHYRNTQDDHRYRPQEPRERSYQHVQNFRHELEPRYREESQQSYRYDSARRHFPEVERDHIMDRGHGQHKPDYYSSRAVAHDHVTPRENPVSPHRGVEMDAETKMEDLRRGPYRLGREDGGEHEQRRTPEAAWADARKDKRKNASKDAPKDVREDSQGDLREDLLKDSREDELIDELEDERDGMREDMKGDERDGDIHIDIHDGARDDVREDITTMTCEENDGSTTPYDKERAEKTEGQEIRRRASTGSQARSPPVTQESRRNSAAEIEGKQSHSLLSPQPRAKHAGAKHAVEGTLQDAPPTKASRIKRDIVKKVPKVYPPRKPRARPIAVEQLTMTIRTDSALSTLASAAVAIKNHQGDISTLSVPPLSPTIPSSQSPPPNSDPSAESPETSAEPTLSSRSGGRSSIKTHIPQDAGGYRCELCPGERFGRVHDLKRHQISKHNEMTWPCDFCHRPFVRRDALLRHYSVKAARHDGVHPTAGEEHRLQEAKARAKLLC